MVTQNGSTATLHFTYESGIDCTVSGALVQTGRLSSIPAATYVCTGGNGVNTGASVTEMRITSLGIEGRLTAPVVALGCREEARFGGPKQP